MEVIAYDKTYFDTCASLHLVGTSGVYMTIEVGALEIGDRYKVTLEKV